jgi:transketolase
VVVPADVVEAEKAIWAAGTTDGPFYLRVGRPKLPVLYDDSYDFAVGRADVRRDGTDATVIACGLLVHVADRAAEMLAAEGVSLRVINMATIKPLDEAAVVAAARETGAIVTAEEHSVIGGLGTAVARCLALQAPVPMEQVGVQDRFGMSGKWQEVIERYGLTPDGIVQAVRRVLARKSS